MFCDYEDNSNNKVVTTAEGKPHKNIYLFYVLLSTSRLLVHLQLEEFRSVKADSESNFWSHKLFTFTNVGRYKI